MNGNLIFLFLLFCDFTTFALSEECGKIHTNKLEGGSCSINSKKREEEHVKWYFNGQELKNSSSKAMELKLHIDEKGPLFRLLNISLYNTGKYEFNVYNNIRISQRHEVLEITVYEKPRVLLNCGGKGNASLTCETFGKKYLDISWREGDQEIKLEKSQELILDKVKKRTLYSCSVTYTPDLVATSNTLDLVATSNTLSCNFAGSVDTLFGYNFWFMVSLLAGGGALVLLLITALVIGVYYDCRQQKKRQQEEEELRLMSLYPPSDASLQRSKRTARGQPAPPVPEEGSTVCVKESESPPPKAQVRVRPPPPPQDDEDVEEDPPPLPRPRKQPKGRKTQVPYRVME